MPEGATSILAPVPGAPAQNYLAPKSTVRGLLSPGNIDLYSRPRVKNADGSISTVRSLSFGDDQGREILVPTVSDDGRIMSDEEAIQMFFRTGRHLGIFDSPRAANLYARQLHKEQERYYSKPSQ